MHHQAGGSFDFTPGSWTAASSLRGTFVSAEAARLAVRRESSHWKFIGSLRMLMAGAGVVAGPWMEMSAHAGLMNRQIRGSRSCGGKYLAFHVPMLEYWACACTGQSAP